MGGTPTGALAQAKKKKAPIDIGFTDAIKVVAKKVRIPVPRGWQMQWPDYNKQPHPNEGYSQVQDAIDVAKRIANEAIRQTLAHHQRTTGNTVESICQWYDRNYRSKGMSILRVGMALGGLLLMYWDLKTKRGTLSIKEAELKNQLAGVVLIIAAGGHADSIVRDACAALDNPI